MNASMCSALALSTALIICGCTDTRAPSPSAAGQDPLIGAWRTQIRFSGGAFADMKDLEFMYVFNAGGTMTESSNYDGAPPVPPAYGVWRKTGPRQYELKYAFYATKPPAAFEDIAKGGGWSPAGTGVFSEKITLAEDGKSYTAAIGYAAFDPLGKPAEGGGDASGTGSRMGF